MFTNILKIFFSALEVPCTVYMFVCFRLLLFSMARNGRHSGPCFLWMDNFLLLLRVVGMIWKDAGIYGHYQSGSHQEQGSPLRDSKDEGFRGFGSYWKGQSSKSQGNFYYKGRV